MNLERELERQLAIVRRNLVERMIEIRMRDIEADLAAWNVILKAEVENRPLQVVIAPVYGLTQGPIPQ